MSLLLYVSEELARESGATYRQIHHWTSKGYLKTAPIRGAKTGSGMAKVYLHEEVLVARGLLIGVEAMAEVLRDAATTPGLPVLLTDGFEVTYNGEAKS